MEVVEAQHRQSIERQVAQEVDKALLEQLEVPAMRHEVIVVDVGDDRDQGLQVGERGVALVRFGDQIAARAQPGIGCRRSSGARR